MFSIGEFSKITGLSVKTLRFYHEKNLLVPATVEPESGYRYYSDANVDTGRVIVALRKLEFSLDEIETILEGCDDQSDLLEYLVRRKETVIGQIRRQQDIASLLDKLIQDENYARFLMKNSEFNVEEKTLKPMVVAGVRMKGRYSDCGQAFSKLGKLVGRYICGKPMLLHYDDEYHENDADFEPCFPIRKAIEVDGLSVHELGAARSVSLLHLGPYDQLGRSYAKVFQYAKQRGHEIALPTREVYIKGPGIIFKGNPKKYLTEIQLPIRDEH